MARVTIGYTLTDRNIKVKYIPSKLEFWVGHFTTFDGIKGIQLVPKET